MPPLKTTTATVIGLVAVLVLASPGCGRRAAAPAFRDFEGPDLPDEQVARLDWSGFALTGIDGKPTHPGQTRARLRPGPHTLRLGATAHAGGPFDPPLVGPAATARFDLKPGTLYRVRRVVEHGWGPSTFAIGVEDVATGEVVYGEKPGGP